MDMNLLKLILIFAVIVAIIWIKKPLHWAFIAGIAATMVLCMIPINESGQVIWGTISNWSKMAIVLDIYLITFLQRLLDKRQQIQKAQVDMVNLFNNRIVNALLIPIIIGFLPSPAALILCGQIVDQATGEYCDPKQKAIITSYFRHIPESFLPTYPVILLLCGFSGLPRDEKSRTFSSNSKRSYILRTSSRSRRLILSSIVSFAVWLKCTRTI